MGNTANNYLSLSNGKIACEVFGKNFGFTKKELEEIITLYNAVSGDWQKRKLVYRDEDGQIILY